MMARVLPWALMSIMICLLPACSPDDGSRQTKAEEAVDEAALSDAEVRAFFAGHACNACHEVDEQRIGPAYRDVALRYADDDRAARTEWLAQKIIHGGAGSWGVVPMVTNPKVTPDEARAVAQWILALDKDKKVSR